MSPGAIQREHQQLARALAERMLADEGLELGDDVRAAPEVDVGRNPLLDRDEAKLLEPARLGLRPVLEGELGERRAAPEVERLREQRPALLGGGGSRVRE